MNGNLNTDALTNKNQDEPNCKWLEDILKEVGLLKFYDKLTQDLQLTKLAHFDYVCEDDLTQAGLSKPAARRLLAAIKKRKSFVNYLKNRIVNKLIPSFTSSCNNHTNINNTNSGKFKYSSNGTQNKNALLNNKSINENFCQSSCLINSEEIVIKEELGRGVHGFVRKGEWTSPNGRVIEVALKVLRRDSVTDPGGSFNEFVKEISVMHQLNHPNIIKLYGIVLSSPMMMVTELAPLGNLRDWMRNVGKSAPISQLINFSVQIARGMEYLESRRFVHRDLAARNIFLGQGKKILIGDMGLMRSIPTEENHYVMSERTKIPFPWCAPESLKLKQFSSASDVYMFGITLWEIFSFGKEPWIGLTLDEIMKKIWTTDQRLPCPNACPGMVYQTLLQCWDVNPELRPKFSTLFQYLSTSYPLEVKSIKPIVNDPMLLNEIIEQQLSSNYLQVNKDQQSDIVLLECLLNDRILVIDGHPEKYWWKGQNQRTFEIGLFPLSSTKWLAPKRNPNYISVPLKNSFVHAGHSGSKGKWGDPGFIDKSILGNPVLPQDAPIKNGLIQSKQRLINGENHRFVNGKSKTKARLSRLFGINSNFPSQILPPSHSYQKFNNDSMTTSSKVALLSSAMANANLNKFPDLFDDDGKPVTKNNDWLQAKNKCQMQNSEPLLIDFSDESDSVTSAFTQADFTDLNQGVNLHLNQRTSLIDMDDIPKSSDVIGINLSASNSMGKFNSNTTILQRHSSDTNINRMNVYNEVEQNDYNFSDAGSWRTGTFDGSIYDVYSNYYCPQDA